MTQIIPFPKPEPPVSTMRSRDKVLSHLLPKMVGIMWEYGGLTGSAGWAFHPAPNLEIMASRFNSNLFLVGVYTIAEPGDMNPMNVRGVKKVFSAQLIAGSMGDPKYFRYWAGRCAILSWRRGVWEDLICEHPAGPRTMAHVAVAGLAR